MALGLGRDGWRHKALVELDEHACCTMLQNNPDWPVIRGDLRHMPLDIDYADMVCGGPPCQPFSTAGAQKGHEDERDMLLPAMSYAVTMRPRIILFENVPGLMARNHRRYRRTVEDVAARAGYAVRWIRFNCADWGVPQRRLRIAVVCVRDLPPMREWPALPGAMPRRSLAETLLQSGMPARLIPAQLTGKKVFPTVMCGGDSGKGSLSNGTKTARELRRMGIHDGLSPTILGGGDGRGTCNGGPKQRSQWARLGVDARSAASEPLAPTIMGGHQTCARSNSTVEVYRTMGLDPRCAESGAPYKGLVRLSMRNVAAIQGFPPNYEFHGSKRSQYRQIGNALPPPAAEQLGKWARRLMECCGVR